MARVVVVTGAGTGIGRAVAQQFAKDGADVIITGRRRVPLDETVASLGPPARAIVCDGTDPEQVRALAEAVPTRVDVLVNNAGGNTNLVRHDSDSLADTKDAWLANFAANVITAVLATEAFTPKFADGGAVISIGSIAAEYGAGSYGAAKAALASWNTAAARDLGPRGVTSNVVAPGYIADTEFFRDTMTESRRDALIGSTFNKRAGSPNDIADTVAFLASPGARHITGQVVHVSGGARTTR